MNFSKLNNQTKIRLLLAEDHTILRQGLARLLAQEADIEVVGEAANGEVAVKLAAQVNPDIILMDMGMPKMDGIEATRLIHSEFPHVRIIGLSMHDETDRAEAMIRAGASRYMIKTHPTQDLLEVIRSCAKSKVA